MKKNNTYRILLILIMACQAAYGQYSANASLDTLKMLIGDRNTLRLSIITKPNSQLLPDSSLSLLKQQPWFDNNSTSNWTEIIRPDSLIFQQEIPFTVFDSGSFSIPILPFTILQNGQTIQVQTQAIALEVNTPSVDTIALAGIKDIIQEPFGLLDVLPAILYTVLAFALIGVGYWWYQKRKNRVPDTTPEVVIIKRPADEVALEKLQVLAQKELWQQGFIKDYQSELTYILREYLEGRFAINALEMTTDQTIEALPKINFPDQLLDRTRNVLQIADLVKFAKATPPADMYERALADVQQIIMDTKPPVSDKKTTN